MCKTEANERKFLCCFYRVLAQISALNEKKKTLIYIIHSDSISVRMCVCASLRYSLGEPVQRTHFHPFHISNICPATTPYTILLTLIDIIFNILLFDIRTYMLHCVNTMFAEKLW